MQRTTRTSSTRTAILLSAGFICTAAVSTNAADRAEESTSPLLRVAFMNDARRERVVEGRIVVEAQDGGLLLQGRDGRLWTVTPKQLQKRQDLKQSFKPLTADELGREMLDEFGEGFEIVATRRYVICTNAGRKYGEWCGTLFERLFESFETHWRTARLDLEEPAFPLPAVVFADRDGFAKFAEADARIDATSTPGYYSTASNRIVLYDLTASPGSAPARTNRDITRKVAKEPFAASTVVHEAVHQIAFNTGLHTRYADNPLWLTEGMAMYFETPDLTSRTGWKTVGNVNPRRLAQFADYARNRRKADSLETLLANNNRFTDAETAGDAYAEAWALTYFLIKTRRREYAEYLKAISKKRPLVWDKPDARLATFKKAFGSDLERMDRDFLRYTSRQTR